MMNSEHSVVNKDVEVSSGEKVFFRVNEGLWRFAEGRHAGWLMEEKREICLNGKQWGGIK